MLNLGCYSLLNSAGWEHNVLPSTGCLDEVSWQWVTKSSLSLRQAQTQPVVGCGLCCCDCKLLLQRSGTSRRAGWQHVLAGPWLWQSPGTFPVKTNGRIVVGQVLFCVGNDTCLLQAHTGTGEVFHSSICFWDIRLPDFSYS